MSKKANWTTELEKLLRHWQRQISHKERSHGKFSRRYNRYDKLLGGPAALLSGIAGSGSLTVLRNCNTQEYCETTRLVMGIMTCVSAALISAMAYLNYGKKSESHSNSAERYASLNRIITTTLSIPKESRGDPIEIITSIRNQYDYISSVSPSLKGLEDENETLMYSAPQAQKIRGRELKNYEGTDGLEEKYKLELGETQVDIELGEPQILSKLRAGEMMLKTDDETLKYQLERFQSGV